MNRDEAYSSLQRALSSFFNNNNPPLDRDGQCLYCDAQWSQMRAQFGDGIGIEHEADCDWANLRKAFLASPPDEAT